MAKNNGGGAIGVLVAASSSVRRTGLETIVKTTLTLKLVGSAHTLTALSPHAREFHADVVLVDVDHSDPHFLTAAASLGQTGVAPILVTLIDNPDAGWTSRALRVGVRAMLPRDAPSHEIVAAIQAAHSGLVLLDPEVTLELARHVHLQNGNSDSEAFEELTPREIEVLRMLAEGLGNKQMARRLQISEHTVKFHVSSILGKLGASSRTEAVTLGIRMGLILL